MSLQEGDATLYRIEMSDGSGLFSTLKDHDADAVDRMMTKAHVIAPDSLRPFKHSKKRFLRGKYWFTDRGWLVCGKRLYRYLQDNGYDVVLLTIESECDRRVVFRDQYQVSLIGGS